MSFLTKLALDAAKKVAVGVAKTTTTDATKIVSDKAKDSLTNIAKTLVNGKVDQAKALVRYTINNIEQFRNIVYSLERKTKILIEKIFDNENGKLSFDEKRELKKIKNEAKEKLQYLYLCRDYFVYLSKLASDITLKKVEYNFIVKFAPFFDGKKVIELEKESNSLFFVENFLSEYVKEIKNFEMPDIHSEIERFEKSVMSVESKKAALPADTTNALTPLPAPATICEEVRCDNCHRAIDVNTKFCPNCGVKIETQKYKFCVECGTKLLISVKFCPECGHKSE